MLPFLLLLATADTAGYWQQQVAYRINASLDEAAGVLTGHVRISYENRSPDTLRDFYVHQYLNAFRPGSRWSATDSAEGRERFQHLKDPDYAFERITGASVQGAALKPDYPIAPDSTVAHWTLPRPLVPGDSVVVEVDWQARPSTLPRRQGRQGRRFDFAQWYPKVVVYDRYGWEAHALYPAGEFYGEFATYDVTLDLPADQVIGATGVPVEGDPGWEHAKADPALRVDYQRDWYHVPRTTQCGQPAERRKCVRFRAEDVHHFAFSLNPQYVYEEGRYGTVVVRVLYLPEDRQTWGGGIAVGRTVTALAWLDSLYGTFAWPQLTNVHRIEGGGTEFPMMVMDGGAGLGLILHEVGHNYTMGILANNEWREGFLDEGFTSFQTAWYFETHGGGPAYPGIEAYILELDLDRWSEPVSMISERFRDFPTYNAMIYTKAQLFYEQLRYIVGDGVLRRILRTYYSRWKLKHVDERAFRAVCEEVSGQDLGWLFGQWLHGTPLIDYRLKRAQRRRQPDGSWRTAVTIERLGDGWMPVEIGNRRGDTIYARATGQPEVERIEFASARKPGRLMLDPRVRTHDWNMLNNRERGFWGRGGVELRLDNPTRDVARRDKLVSAWVPVAWWNDAGGLTLGVRSRENYFGRFERNLFLWSAGLRGEATNRFSVYARIENPVVRSAPPSPRTTTSLAAWTVEGRAGAALHVDRSLQRRLVDRAEPHAGFDAMWMATTDLSYLDRRLWEDGGTIEAGPWFATTVPYGGDTLRVRLETRAGLAYWKPGPGIVARQRYDAEGFVRAIGEASWRAPFWLGTTLGVRAFAGGYGAPSLPLRQRRIGVAGADPYETFTNPLLRSRGALFVRPDFFYHAPGGANLRGFTATAGGRWALALNVEATKPVRTRGTERGGEGGGGMMRGAALYGFFDGGPPDPLAIPTYNGRGAATTLYDAGVGLVTRQRLGDRSWTMRFEVPLVVNRWDFSADTHGRGQRTTFRWQVSLEPSF